VGYDVIAIAERDDLVGRNDRTVLEIASGEGRAVITNDIKDFRPLAAERLAQGGTHAGLILLPASRTRTRRAMRPLANAIKRVLRDHRDGIKDSERWIPPLSGD
jgi:hypothetical protein